ncbi:MAG: TylF/MycF family methyltransferase, partial [Chlamydiae bacterium]|nr:TylF/MycF family methyltransferase [Chlamydiota bacterium]
ILDGVFLVQKQSKIQNAIMIPLLKRFGAPHLPSIHNIKSRAFLFTVAKGLQSVLAKQRETERLHTAFCDPKLFQHSELLSDVGFVWSDPSYSFFGGSKQDRFHPYNPIGSLREEDFDIILGNNHIDLSQLLQAVQQTYSSLKTKDFISCLNINKLAIISALCYLTPDSSSIVEVGSYMCGTTIFMAKLFANLNKTVTIYACDTFEGMPAATEVDKRDKLYYDSGLFTDNKIEVIEKRVRKMGVSRSIRLIAGNVANTLPKLEIEKLAFLFLDTDQYSGTKAGLDFAMRYFPQNIIIDDSSLSGVQEAIREFLSDNLSYRHSKLVTNFDFLCLPMKECSSLDRQIYLSVFREEQLV